jgi:hypothetical protein
MRIQMMETHSRILWALGLLLCVPCAWCQQPEKITLCDIKDHPLYYNHKLVEVEGFVSHDFEDFSISTPECPYTPAIWLEYGGKHKSGTIYCCGGDAERTRANACD